MIKKNSRIDLVIEKKDYEILLNLANKENKKVSNYIANLINEITNEINNKKEQTNEQ